jgi:Uma2 family endonuclease
MSAPPKATFKDLALLPEEVRAEVIDGEIVEKAAPSFEHANTQLGLGSIVRVEFHGERGGLRSGGWWILSEVDVELETHAVYRPDLAGWRRESLPAQPVERPVRVRPDWVCEVLSRSNAQNDLVKKFRGYHRAGVSHYWIVDPDNRSLIVYRYQPAGYLAVLTAGAGETIRAEPFDAIEIAASDLFG